MQNKEIPRYFKSPRHVYDFLRNNLPEQVSLDDFDRAYGCYRDAMVTVHLLGGPEAAQAFWLYIPLDPQDPEFDFIDAHVYVVVRDEPDELLAYGNEGTLDFLRTNGFIRENAEDITDDLMSRNWSGA